MDGKTVGGAVARSMAKAAVRAVSSTATDTGGATDRRSTRRPRALPPELPFATLRPVTREEICEILTSAAMPAEIDEDGDVLTSAGLHDCFVRVNEDGDVVKIFYLFATTHRRESLALLRALNDFNRTYTLAKARWFDTTDGDRAAIMIDTEFRVDDGLSAASLVRTLQYLASVIEQSTELDDVLVTT
jgi:hypothetical protein